MCIRDSSLLQHHSAPECSLVLLLSYTYYKLNWAMKWDKLRMKPGSEPGFESSWCLFFTILISLNACFGSKYSLNFASRRKPRYKTPSLFSRGHPEPQTLQTAHDCRQYRPRRPCRSCRLSIFFPFFFGEILISRNTNINKQDRRSPQNVDCRLSIFFLH